MPAPSKRQPRSAPPPAAETIGAGLAPAPGNGTPFAELGQREAAAVADDRKKCPECGNLFVNLGSHRRKAHGVVPEDRTSSRRGLQLGLRVPEEVYQRLDHVSTETGISRQRLLVDALSAWLERYEAT